MIYGSQCGIHSSGGGGGGPDKDRYRSGKTSDPDSAPVLRDENASGTAPTPERNADIVGGH